MSHLRLQANRELLAGKSVVGIGPSSDKHHAVVVLACGSQIANAFSFSVTDKARFSARVFQGYPNLWTPAPSSLPASRSVTSKKDLNSDPSTGA